MSRNRISTVLKAAIGIETCEVVARRAVYGGEATTQQNLSIGLHGHTRSCSRIAVMLGHLRADTRAQGISPGAFLARQVRNLHENLERPLHPDVAGATGIVSAQVAGEEAHRDSLERKHS